MNRLEFIHLIKSHPSWVCGLKPQRTGDYPQRKGVTPFVGVWIETDELVVGRIEGYVTPFVGVWIETLR